MSKSVAIINIVVFTLVLQSVVVSGNIFSCFKKKVADYDTIDKWIKKHVPKDSDPATSVRLAADHFHANQNGMKPALVEVWKQFIALEKVEDPSIRCTLEATNILKANAAAADVDRTDKKYEKQIQIIIDQYLTKHANDCESVYIEKLKSLKVKVSAAEYPLITTAAYQYRSTFGFFDVYRPNVYFLEDMLDRFNKLNDEGAAKIIAIGLSEDPEANSDKIMGDGEKNVNQAEIKRLVMYAFEKFKSYSDYYMEVLEPATFDAGTHPLSLVRYGNELLTNEMFNYYVCQVFARRDWNKFIETVGSVLPGKIPIIQAYSS